MWHPNKAQWRVIWIAVILGLAFAIPMEGGVLGFGVAALIGALMVWQMEGRRKD